MELKTFEVMFTNSSSVRVQGTRLLRPEELDGILVVDDNERQEREDFYGETDCIVLSVPNHTLMCAFEVDKALMDEEEDFFADDSIPL